MGGVEALRAALADRYAIEREVGHGAMATVYLARDLRFARDVAIKVLSPDFSAAVGVERFLREIDVVAKLNHPHILPLLDSGKAGGFLYYVMPYVEGSLRNRLVKETQLRIDEAITLTREIALALDYAHREGIVHRDVKPENILLSRGYALLGDFGIARVLSPAEVERLTNTGASPGTPAYMSPEQCGGGGTLDGRSDLYSLGCVVYELLAGAPPFTGPSAQAIAARHLTDPVPPLRTVRRTVSEELEHVVLRVLEKVPADRYATGAEFASALAAPEILLQVQKQWWRRFTRWKAAAAIGAVALVGIVAVRAVPGFWTAGASGLDSTRYAILPFERDSGLVSFNEDQLLQDAMTAWSGVTVVDRLRMEAVLPPSRARQSASDVQAIARRVGAGRYVVGQVSLVGDSLRIHAAVYGTTVRGPPIHEATAKIGLDRSRLGAAFARVADRLLFGEAGPGARLDPSVGTTSRPARQFFEHGIDSVYTWNLAAAESSFNAAIGYDPDYSSALVWLALVRSWNGATPPTWQSAAERSAALSDRLGARDRFHAEALVRLSGGDGERACRTWSEATVQFPKDFTIWYGLANCLSGDSVVLRDPKSPTGWRFRSSYSRATKAYQRAYQLLPSLHNSLSAGSFGSVRSLLFTRGNGTRIGRELPPDTMTFAAYPSWQGDSLAFIPHPIQVFSGQKVVPRTMALAVRQERQLFHDIAMAWVSAFPKSPEALEALAVSLELLGDPGAIDTLRQARALAKTPDDRIRLTATEVWMRVKFSAPFDSVGLSVARALAESLLRGFSAPSVQQPLLMASLAALTGRAQLAAELTRHPAFLARWEVPASIHKTGGPLLAFAALGGPVDSLRELEPLVIAAIEKNRDRSTQEDQRMQWLGRPAAMGFPHYRFKSINALAGRGVNLLDAEWAYQRGDTLTVRRIFHDLQVARQSIPSSDLTFDALYPEAWLLRAVGDLRGAIAWIEPTLSQLSTSAPQVFVDPANAGALVQSMALRAELADQVGDHSSAERWARAVTVLWRDADPFLQTVHARMEQLARATP